MRPECPLCHSNNSSNAKGADQRLYHFCKTCALIFADSRHHLSNEQEKARYNKHQNSLNDNDYLDFLKRAVNPALTFIKPAMHGLDYGCGPVRAIEHILKGHNIPCDSYDPFFLPKPIDPPYDFIFSTEVFEHFFYPDKELKNLSAMLNKGGYLIVMTELYKASLFKDWYYTKDPTHICFYNMDTIKYICREYGFEVVYTDSERVVILAREYCGNARLYHHHG